MVPQVSPNPYWITKSSEFYGDSPYQLPFSYSAFLTGRVHLLPHPLPPPGLGQGADTVRFFTVADALGPIWYAGSGRYALSPIEVSSAKLSHVLTAISIHKLSLVWFLWLQISTATWAKWTNTDSIASWRGCEMVKYHSILVENSPSQLSFLSFSWAGRFSNTHFRYTYHNVHWLSTRDLHFGGHRLQSDTPPCPLDGIPPRVQKELGLVLLRCVLSGAHNRRSMLSCNHRSPF